MIRMLLTALLFGSCIAACTRPAEQKQAADSTSAPQADTPVTQFSPDTTPVASPGSFSESTTATGQHYIVYVPKGYTRGDSLPLMVCFDPQGNGRVPVHRYAGLADEFGFILAGSNAVKNGLGIDASAAMASDLAGTVLSRLGTSHRGLFLCGFSGGAKVALVAPGRMKGVTGVVHCGAGLPAGIPAPTVPTYGITGTRDMNYPEVIEFVNRLALNPLHHLDLTEADHAWPEAGAMRRAFRWCELISCRQTGRCDQKSLQAFVKMIDQRAAAAMNRVQRMRYLRCGKDVMQGIAPVNSWDNRIEALSKDPVYQQAIVEESRGLSSELNRRQFLLDAFRSQPDSWWTQVTADLGRMKQDPVNARLLAYISLACYSMSRQAMEQGNMPEVARLNRIYLLADPENSEANFTAALLFARAGAADSSRHYLRRAVQYGFSDPARFSEESGFKSLLNEGEQKEMLEGIRKNQSAW